MLRLLLIISIVSCSVGRAFAELPALEREITLTLTNEKLNTALNKIQEQTGLVFSYPTSILDNAQPISLKLRQKTVREALLLILPKTVTFKAKNNYVILKEKPLEKNPKKTELKGYVYDKTTEKKLANVTIYDKNTLQSVTSDDYGFYSISVPSNNQNLSVNKENYKDTALTISEIKDNNLNNIVLNPITDTVRSRDSVLWKAKLKDFGEYTLKLFKKFQGYVNTLNVKDTMSRPVQVSFLPFIGTNHKLSGSIYNHYSFNIIGGYSRGVRSFEAGTVFNINKENVTGLQMAGIFNLVGNTVKGAQFAGLYNITGGGINGFQSAGLMNFNNGPRTGVQSAGLMNINKGSSMGISMAGLMNINKGISKGAELAGLMNINQKSMTGFAAAGLCNLAKDTLRGAQMAGLFNNSQHSKSAVQLAGMFNHSEEGSSRMQIAGLFNRAKHVKGIQLAPFNFCDSASGIPIGVFSFVKKGVHQLEVSADEIFKANINYRTGVPAFYNIFGIGFGPRPSGSPLWSLMYGLGTSFRVSKKLRSDFTLSTQHVSRGDFSTATNELYRAYLGLEYRLVKNISIAGGPVFNVYTSDATTPYYEGNYDNVAPYTFNETRGRDGINVTYWLGGRIAIRFF